MSYARYGQKAKQSCFMTAEWDLKEHYRILYYNMLTACKLNSYLANIDRQAEEMFSRLVNTCRHFHYSYFAKML